MAKKNKVRVAIIGVGNCAAALVQGVEFYRDAAEDAEIPGLMHATVGTAWQIGFSARLSLNQGGHPFQQCQRSEEAEGEEWR